MVDYFGRLDRASDRVMFEELGKSTMDKPFVMATISAPENLARLEEYKTIQDQLADPRKLGAPGVRDRRAAELIRKGKTIVLITCGIHSTEVGSYLSSMLIAHRLASSNEPEIQNILQNTIILLVPSLNPDGVDIVKNWYDKTLGTPYEGTDPPELYHKYVGHDNNRDWYAFTQVETKITVDKIHNVWHPQIVHDIHQQGQVGSRLFLPPYMQPVEPNVPKQIVEGFTELGNWMAGQMRAKGFQGITTNSTYDAWSPSRAYSHYHGGVRILSETASAKIATPITLKFEELNAREGYDPKKESANFGPLWRGGEWKLRDITNYMTTAAFLLLRHASEKRERWLVRFYEIGKEAVRSRKRGELYGYVVTQSSGGNLAKLEDILRRAQIEIHNTQVGKRIAIDGTPHPMLSRFVPIAQPYGMLAKALLESQRYPQLLNPSGNPIPPYDATAHTLSLLMGVEVRPVKAPFRNPHERWTGGSSGGGNATFVKESGLSLGMYRSSVPAMDEGWTRWILRNHSVLGQIINATDPEVITDNEIKKGLLERQFSTLIIPEQPASHDSQRLSCWRDATRTDRRFRTRRRKSTTRIRRSGRHARLPQSSFRLRDRTIQTSNQECRCRFTTNGFLRTRSHTSNRTRHDSSNRAGNAEGIDRLG